VEDANSLTPDCSWTASTFEHRHARLPWYISLVRFSTENSELCYYVLLVVVEGRHSEFAAKAMSTSDKNIQDKVYSTLDSSYFPAFDYFTKLLDG
jgi:hypothetical protein